MCANCAFEEFLEWLDQAVEELDNEEEPPLLRRIRDHCAESMTRRHGDNEC